MILQWMYVPLSQDVHTKLNHNILYKKFLSNLKDHLLSRILGHSFEGDENTYSEDDRRTIKFLNNCVYRHKVLRVNYTTYDMRRSQDSINPRTHPDIMTLSHEDSDTDGTEPHPYWYARVIGIFHTQVIHTGPHSTSSEPQYMEFLWVHWFGRDLTYPAGWEARRLHRIGFLPDNSDGAFGFLNPSEVIRSVHLIPAFAHGKMILQPSMAQQSGTQEEDWIYYYVNM